MPAKPYTLREAVPADADYFAPRLRESDRIELTASQGRDVRLTLQRSIEISAISTVAEFGGKPVLLLGCAGREGLGVPWLVATTEAAKYPAALHKIAKQHVTRFLRHWPALLNCVDERNAVSVRWLERLGFEVHEAIPFGINGERFRPFTMRG